MGKGKVQKKRGGRKITEGRRARKKSDRNQGSNLYLFQIVYNLMSNAIKYTVRGSVHVSLASRDDSVVLSVSDTGTSLCSSSFALTSIPY